MRAVPHLERIVDFQDVSPEEQHQMEEVLERIAKGAEELGEQEGHR